MNKKTKWAIPFAVLALTCGIAAGCRDGHEHSYTQWAHNETQHWKECPDDHEKDDGTLADHVFDDGVCVCGATEQTPPVTDVTITDGTTDTNGTVTLSKTTAKAGDSVTVTVAPSDGYQLKSLTVNGVNVFGVMTGNTYQFTVSENTTVVAAFEKIASSSVDAQITGKKYGVTGNSLAAGTQVTLSATGREDVTATITADGKIQIPEIAGDNWQVKVDGYVAASINIPRDETYSTAIALEYDLMENLSISWGNQDAEDFSEQNDGKITHTGAYWQWVSTKDSYDSVAFTATALKGGARQGVFVRFKGNSYSNDEYVLFGKENNEKIGRCDATDGLTGKNIFANQWGKEALITPAANDSYEITVVRSGSELYFFVDGEFKLKETLDSKYEDLECYVGLYCGDATTISGARDFKIEDASEWLNLTVTDETATGAGGSVTLSAASVAVNAPVTVTLTPDTNYKIKSLTVNGVAVSLSDLRDNTYTFNVVKKGTVVAAEFEEAQTVESVVLTVTAASGFTADGTEITLEQLGEKWTGTVQDGTVTFGGAENPVALGDLNVTADFGGYQIKLGTVKITLPAEGTTATAQVTLGFTGSGIEYGDAVSSANPATGELTYKLGNANNGAYNNKYDIADIEDGGYFATKVKFNDIGDNKRSLSLILVVQKSDGTTKEIKYVIQNADRFFGENGKFYMNLDDDSIGGGNGAFEKSNAVNIDGYSSALKGDGLWLVLSYHAETGALVTYAGTDLTSVRPVKTWGTLPAGLKVVKFGAGNWFGDSNQEYGGNNDTATVTFKYGKTMADIGMSVEEKVTVTASVNDETKGSVVLDATDGKYYSGTQVTVTVTANAGCYLQSLKVGEAEAITEGWTTDGNVYTYTFTAPEGGATVVVTLAESPEVTLSGVTVNISDGTNAIDLGETVQAKLTPSVGDAYDVTLTKGENGAYTFGGTFLKGEYRLSLVGKNLGYGSVAVTIAETVSPITMKYSLTGETVKGPREDASITVTNDTITIVGTKEDAFAEWGSGHNDNQVPYVTLNIPDEVKNAKNVMLQFNLKTSNQTGYFINGFGVGMTGFNGLRMLFADTGDKAYTPDGKIITAVLNGRKTGEDNISAGGYCSETYGWIETLALTNGGVNIRAVRNGTALKFYAQNELGEWVLIRFLVPVNGDYGNLQYVDQITVDESALNDFRFLANGADWTVSAITVTLNPEEIDHASYCYSNITVTSDTDLTGVNVTLTDKDDATKTYTVQMKKNDAGKYYIEGYFRAGNYNITVEGFTCTSAGKDENNQATTALWIDNVGGQCWGITLEAETAPDEGDQTPAD